MKNEKQYLKPVEYAALKKISPAAVTGLMQRGSVKVVLKDGRRLIEI